MLVVACNTASSHALDEVTGAVEVPVIGVVEPGVRAILATGARRVGVIATEGTVRSGAYQQTLARQAGDVAVEARACPLLVPLAEEGWGDHAVTEAVAAHYLAPLLEWGVEALLLGCTHYPLLLPSLSRAAGPEVTLVDSATSVARAVAEGNVDRSGRGRGGDVRLQLTDASDNFLRVARDILGELPGEVEVVDIGAAAAQEERP
jgi:glutamate racemase